MKIVESLRLVQRGVMECYEQSFHRYLENI